MSIGKDYNNLNQIMGAFRVTLKQAYIEAVSPHVDGKLFRYFYGKSHEDFSNMMSGMWKLERQTRIKRGKKNDSPDL